MRSTLMHFFFYYYCYFVQQVLLTDPSSAVSQKGKFDKHEIPSTHDLRYKIVIIVTIC
jgi:hypothetical protein